MMDEYSLDRRLPRFDHAAKSGVAKAMLHRVPMNEVSRHRIHDSCSLSTGNIVLTEVAVLRRPLHRYRLLVQTLASYSDYRFSDLCDIDGAVRNIVHEAR
jgi:hypothetical protein